MTVYFVSRHEGARFWARYHGRRGLLPHRIDRFVEHLNAQAIERGDIVIGTLPLQEIAAVQRNGGRFIGLDIRVPPHRRGQELSATEMVHFGATLTPYRVSTGEAIDLAPSGRARKVPTLPPVWVSLVSKELAPHLIACGTLEAGSVELVVTPDMTASGRQLEARLRELPGGAIGVKTHKLEATGHGTMLQWALRHLDELVMRGHEAIYLNLTGGTKLMALAFAEAAERSGNRERIRSFYVDSARSRLEELGAGAAQPLRSVMNVRMLLEAAGLTPTGCAQDTPRYARYAQRGPLLDALLGLEPLVLGKLNAAMEEARARRKDSRDDSSRKRQLPLADSVPAKGLIYLAANRGTKKLRNALTGPLGKAMQECGALTSPPQRLEDGSVELRLRAEDEIDFFGGEWLEVAVGNMLAQSGVDDWAACVTIEGAAVNELDAVAAHGNRLLFIEVKTMNMSREKTAESGARAKKSTVAQDALYKMDSVGTQIARYFNDKWLVSARPLDAADLTRARALGIRVFAGGKPAPGVERLDALPKAIGKWARQEPALARSARFEPSAIKQARRWLDNAGPKPPQRQPALGAGS